MLMAIVIAVLVLAICKWIMWRWSFLAILLYYAECGLELPDKDTIKKYCMKAAFKDLGIKED